MKVHVDCMTSQKLVRLPGKCIAGEPGFWMLVTAGIETPGVVKGGCGAHSLPWTVQAPESLSL